MRSRALSVAQTALQSSSLRQRLQVRSRALSIPMAIKLLITRQRRHTNVLSSKNSSSFYHHTHHRKFPSSQTLTILRNKCSTHLKSIFVVLFYIFTQITAWRSRVLFGIFCNCATFHDVSQIVRESSLLDSNVSRFKK